MANGLATPRGLTSHGLTATACLVDCCMLSLMCTQDTASALDAQAMANGLATPSGLQTTNLTEIGEGRRTVVSLNLDRMADSVSGQTVVDPKGYLTDLKSIKVHLGLVLASQQALRRLR